MKFYEYFKSKIIFHLHFELKKCRDMIPARCWEFTLNLILILYDKSIDLEAKPSGVVWNEIDSDGLGDQNYKRNVELAFK